MKKIILSLSGIAVVAALVIASTGAFFSDTETSTGNTFTAGAIDLKVDSTQHYNGMVCEPNLAVAGTYWWRHVGQSVPAAYPVEFSACDGSWALKDLVPSSDKFFNFADVKPGDSGENTISLHIDNNSAYACADISNIKNDENTYLTPETLAGDMTAGPTGQGELGQGLDFLIWNDTNGNNIWDTGEVGQNTTGGAPLTPQTYTLADGSGPAIPATGTSFLGIAWCAGTFTAGGPGVTPVCDGSTMGNEAQTDSYAADIGLRVVQSRNNSTFRCTPPTGGGQGPTVGANLSAYHQTTDCSVTLDSGDQGSIQHAIDRAAAGNTVCVPSGIYTGPIEINQGITLASLNGPALTTINGGVKITSSNVTVKGFTVDTGFVSAEANPVGFYVAGGSDITIDSNEIDGNGLSQSHGVLFVYNAAYSNIKITNNDIHDNTAAIYEGLHTGSIDITYNNIHDNSVGVAGFTSAHIAYNEFSGASSEAIGVDTSYVGTSVAEYNNFLAGQAVNTYAGVTSVQVTNDYWAGGVLSNNVSALATAPLAASQYPHN